jgi:fumarate hydratase class II
MSNVRIQTDGLRKVEVPAAKLWGAAQTQRSLEHYPYRVRQRDWRATRQAISRKLQQSG